jgi:transcriptional regulator with XRE-family HTH domain
MDDMRVGALFRAVRIRRGWRQEDVAHVAGLSRALVSVIERGHLDRAALGTLRSVARALDIRIDVLPRWRGGEAERLLNAGHSAMHEQLARVFEQLPAWCSAPEVSFSIYGERGVIDIVAWHAGERALLVIELKTALVDVQDLIGSMDRKKRLAAQVVRDRGWVPKTVSVWVIVAGSSTNRRHVNAHRAVLRSAFPTDGHTMRRWLGHPDGAVAGLSLWSNATGGDVMRRPEGRQRVRRPVRRPNATGTGV